MEELYKTLQQHLPADVAKEVNRVLYGTPCRTLELPDAARQLADKEDFDLQGYGIDAAVEQTRAKRIVRIGAIQNKIVLPTDAPIVKQREAIHNRVGQMLHAAHLSGVNIACLQETWHMPFAFCTREKQPWCEFAESAENGPSTKFLSEVKLHFVYNIRVLSRI
jgi:beta-ureidopropionase